MHTLKLLYIDDRFDLNDLGYMERNSLKQVEWETNHRVASSEGGRVSGETQRLYSFYRENTDGRATAVALAAVARRAVRERLACYPGTALRHQRRGRFAFARQRSGADSTIASRRVLRRDHAALRRLAVHLRRLCVPAGRRGIFRLAAVPRRLVSDREADAAPRPDAAIFRRTGCCGSRTICSAHSAPSGWTIEFRLDWIPAPRHELRIKWQWIGIDARTAARLSHRCGGQSDHLPRDPIAPFTVNNLGLQMRYRYEIGPHVGAVPGVRARRLRFHRRRRARRQRAVPGHERRARRGSVPDQVRYRLVRRK